MHQRHIFINRVIQLLLIFLFVVNVGEGFLAPIYAIFVVKSISGATIATVGFAFAVLAVVKSLLQVPIARRIDAKKGERDDFFVMLIGAALGMFVPLSLVVIQATWQLYMVSAVSGVSSACLMAAYYSLFSRHVDHSALGFEWSLFSVWGLTVSVALGGAVGGILADALGFTPVFLLAAAAHFSAALLLVTLYPLLLRERRGKR